MHIWPKKLALNREYKRSTAVKVHYLRPDGKASGTEVWCYCIIDIMHELLFQPL